MSQRFTAPRQRVPAAAKQLSSVSLQDSQTPPPVHGLPGCVQVPPAHTSTPLQKRPSGHGVLLLTVSHPKKSPPASPLGWHTMSVQGLPSSTQRVGSSVQCGVGRSVGTKSHWHFDLVPAARSSGPLHSVCAFWA